MPNTTPLTDAINALTTYANETTGASDTNLSDAVGTLVDGYGQGGGISVDDIATNSAPSGAVVLSNSVSTIKPWAFAYKPITSISADSVTIVDSKAFSHTSLTSLSLPNATGANNFIEGLCENCNDLTTVVLPSWNKPFYTTCFASCPNLVAFDVLGNSFSGNYIFRDCTSLNTIILRNTSVVTMNSTTHIRNTPFESGKSGGTLYVPQSLISSYQSANNWSTILGYENNQILPIEGSIYETQYADGTPIS